MGADAKIDLEKNVIEIHRSPLPVYQSVIEKTRGLAFRTQALGAGMLQPHQSAQQHQSQPVEGAR
jgi:translation initiation factor 3 subunit E